MMRTRSAVVAIGIMALGGLLGWLAGSGRFSVAVPAGPEAVAAPAQPARESERADKPTAGGKKPNIVFVLMDNLG